MNEENNHGGLMMFLLLLPVLLVTMVLSLISWLAARNGASYRVTRWLAFIPALAISNFFGILIFIAGSFFVSMCSDSHLFQYAMHNAADLSLFMMWGPVVSTFWHFNVQSFHPAIPSNDILIYQLCLFFLFGYRVWRQVSMAIFDSATVRRAAAAGVHPYDFRIERINHDVAYAKQARFYNSKNKTPLLGLLAVLLSGANYEYYTNFDN